MKAYHCNCIGLFAAVSGLSALFLTSLACRPGASTTHPDRDPLATRRDCTVLSNKLVRRPDLSDAEAVVSGTAESQGVMIGGFVVVVEYQEQAEENELSDEDPSSVVADGKEFTVPLPPNKRTRLTLFHGAYIPCMLSVEVPGGHALVVHVVVEPQTGEETLLAD